MLQLDPVKTVVVGEVADERAGIGAHLGVAHAEGATAAIAKGVLSRAHRILRRHRRVQGEAGPGSDLQTNAVARFDHAVDGVVVAQPGTDVGLDPTVAIARALGLDVERAERGDEEAPPRVPERERPAGVVARRDAQRVEAKLPLESLDHHFGPLFDQVTGDHLPFHGEDGLDLHRHFDSFS